MRKLNPGLRLSFALLLLLALLQWAGMQLRGRKGVLKSSLSVAGTMRYHKLCEVDWIFLLKFIY